MEKNVAFALHIFADSYFKDDQIAIVHEGKDICRSFC
jgi:hypothetical protein